MGKKKGKGKKKGSKKGKKGKPDLGDLGPKLSVPEKFIKFQLETRTDVMNTWQDRRSDMFEKNENTKKRLLALQEKQIKLIDMLRKKGLKADEEHKEKTKDAAASMDSLKLKIKNEHTQQAIEIFDLKQELASQEAGLTEETALLNLLEHHKNELGFQWDKKITQLKATVETLEADFVTEHAAIERQFSMNLTHFDDYTDTRMLETKQDASSDALYRQPADDKIAYSDNGWLRHEIDEHQAELKRGRLVVKGLRDENTRLIQTLLGPAFDQNMARRLRSAPVSMRRNRTKTSPPSTPTAHETASLMLTQSLARPPSRQRPASRAGTPPSRPGTSNSRPASRQRSAKLKIASHKKSVIIASGHRACEDVGIEDLERLVEDPQEMLRSLRIFPHMASTNQLPVIKGMHMKRGRSTSSLPKLPRSGHGARAIAAL